MRVLIALYHTQQKRRDACALFLVSARRNYQQAILFYMRIMHIEIISTQFISIRYAYYLEMRVEIINISIFYARITTRCFFIKVRNEWIHL